MHDRRVHAAAVLWIALWIAPLANYYTTYVKAPWKEASRAILSAAQPGDTLLYKNVLEFDRISLNYYVPASFLRAEEIQKSGSPGRFFWPTRTYETAERIQQIQRPWRVAGAYPAGKVTVLLVVHDARMRGPKAP
jgi:hypothetical protein